jgi:hypothetical protein
MESVRPSYENQCRYLFKTVKEVSLYRGLKQRGSIHPVDGELGGGLFRIGRKDSPFGNALQFRRKAHLRYCSVASCAQTLLKVRDQGIACPYVEWTVFRKYYVWTWARLDLKGQVARISRQNPGLERGSSKLIDDRNQYRRRNQDPTAPFEKSHVGCSNGPKFLPSVTGIQSYPAAAVQIWLPVDHFPRLSNCRMFPVLCPAKCHGIPKQRRKG